MSLTATSKFLSLILRHKPETIGIELDEHGVHRCAGIASKNQVVCAFVEGL
ncbi:MAG: RNA 2'-phosphotransferase [Lachnospiraceae bacterium]